MTDNLRIETDHLESLAIEQDESGAAIVDSQAVVDGTGYKLLWDHGLLSFPTAMTVWGIENLRADACTSMAAVCTDLSERLRASAVAYTGTDEQAGENVDRQVL
jgi:hypothetical protein